MAQFSLRNWLGQAWQFTIVETATYLRDTTAIFWTFLYPVALLLIMMLLFGGGGNRSPSLALDVEGTGPAAEQLVSQLKGTFDAIEGLNIELRRVTPGQTSPDQRVRLIVPTNFSEGPDAEPVLVRLNAMPDEISGSMLSLVAQSAAQLNAKLANAPERVQLKYIIAQGKAETNIKATYYVVGLAVLTIVSTALFGFSGPLIDLRARGGLKLFQFMPVHRSAFLTGFGLCRVVILVVFVTLFILAGLSLFGGLRTLSGVAWSLMLALIFVGTISFLAAGLAIAGFITSNSAGSALINLINLPIMFFSDLFIPLSSMPEAVAAVSRMTPVYMLVDAMRGAAAGTHGLADCMPAFVSLSILLIGSAAIAGSTFRWRLKR
ncbi:ABC transporter permease [Asticcacaulis sp.]|uniref:ABC transporter permease n=1 Tax=Asticcacaulis sp. TaxID=1872648 RepID=UPI00261FEA4B|nr:ABC transporter permease [Asticcacaulis sp.]